MRKNIWFALLVLITSLAGIGRFDTAKAQEVGLFPFNSIKSETITLEQRGDEADVHYPEIPDSLDEYPIVAVLQDAGVDKKFYSKFGKELARFGFVVIVPNHFQTPPFPPGTPPNLLPDQFLVLDVVDQMEQENKDPASPLFGIVDTTRAALIGHSFGGVVGLFVIDGRCDGPPFCDELSFGSFERPVELRAGAFYGTNSCSSSGTLSDSRCIDEISIPPNPFGMLIDIETGGFPVTLVQGSLDSLSSPAEAAATLSILDGSALLVSLEGANHYGIANENNPDGAIPDLVKSTIPQAAAVRQVAQASGQLLSANVKGTKVTLCHKGTTTKTLCLS